MCEEAWSLSREERRGGEVEHEEEEEEVEVGREEGEGGGGDGVLAFS